MKRFEDENGCPISPSVCGIAAAVLGAGALSAGASIWGSQSAASAQRDAAGMASDTARWAFGQAKDAAQPFIDAGKSVIPNLQGMIDTTNPNSVISSLLKLVTPGANMTETLEKTPGFQFSRDMGLKATGNALAARGLGGPGGALARGSADYAEGLAGNTFNSVVQALLSSFTGGTNALQNLVNTGSNAASSLSGNAIASGNTIAGAQIGAGNATAAANNATGNAVGGLGNSISTAALLQKLLPGYAGSSPASGGGIYGPLPSPGDPGFKGWGA